jgi:hypothetical protein
MYKLSIVKHRCHWGVLDSVSGSLCKNLPMGAFEYACDVVAVCFTIWWVETHYIWPYFCWDFCQWCFSFHVAWFLYFAQCMNESYIGTSCLRVGMILLLNHSSECDVWCGWSVPDVSAQHDPYDLRVELVRCWICFEPVSLRPSACSTIATAWPISVRLSSLWPETRTRALSPSLFPLPLHPEARFCHSISCDLLISVVLVKVKLSLRVLSTTVWRRMGRGGMAPRILNLGTRLRE